MKDSLCIVTGGTKGIGLACTRALVSRGYKVVVAGRDFSQIEQDEKLQDRVIQYKVDLSDLHSVGEFVSKMRDYPTIDIIINNAGVLKFKREVNQQGIEYTWALNYLSPYMITSGLMDSLNASSNPRVISISSSMHAYFRPNMNDVENKNNYDGFRAYGNSKLALLILSNYLSKKNKAIQFNSVNPGSVFTDFGLHQGGKFTEIYVKNRRRMKEPQDSIKGVIHLVEKTDEISGSYYFNTRRAMHSPWVLSNSLQKKLAKLSEEYVSLISQSIAST